MAPAHRPMTSTAHENSKSPPPCRRARASGSAERHGPRWWVCTCTTGHLASSPSRLVSSCLALPNVHPHHQDRGRRRLRAGQIGGLRAEGADRAAAISENLLYGGGWMLAQPNTSAALGPLDHDKLSVSSRESDWRRATCWPGAKYWAVSLDARQGEENGVWLVWKGGAEGWIGPRRLRVPRRS